MNNFIKNPCPGIIMAFFALFSLNGSAQNPPSSIPRDTLMVAAREIIKATPFCALVSIDTTGQPQVRTMNPFPLGDEIEIWFATGRKSRKVKEIKNNPKVCVYYADHSSAKGYVTITGTAEIIDDKDLLVKMRRPYWDGITNWQDNFVLIKITPGTIHVINYAHGISGDPETSRAATITF
ncbi:MAG TPA: pyridoxamine 5'-phosphate oxidase family protein [Bacteroidales bacterium]|nr:pyridoxamine 5'-phosphate oxidase family protein [Bacteroidales bacterium]